LRRRVLDDGGKGASCKTIDGKCRKDEKYVFEFDANGISKNWV